MPRAPRPTDIIEAAKLAGQPLGVVAYARMFVASLQLRGVQQHEIPNPRTIVDASLDVVDCLTLILEANQGEEKPESRIILPT